MDIKVNAKTVVVFDLDDTLYNELDYLISAYKFIAKKIDPINFVELTSVMLSLYRDGQDVFVFLENKYEVSKSELLSFYRNHNPSISLFSGVLDLFKEIKNKSGSIALLTDGRSITQRNKIKSLGIENYFDFISISEEIGAVKPSLKGFKLIEEKLNKDSYYYIGDNIKKDFIGPNKLNWKTICLVDNGKNIHSYKLNELKENCKPENYIFSLKKLNVI